MSSEQRRASRFPFSPEVFCRVIDPESNQHWPAWVRDFSMMGVSFLIEPRFDPNHLLVLELNDNKPEEVRRFPIHVRHSEVCFPNNCWLHGCVFETPLSSPDLEALAARFCSQPAKRHLLETHVNWIDEPCKEKAAPLSRRIR